MASPLKLPFILFFFFVFTVHAISALTPDGFTLLSLLNRLNVPSSMSSTWNSSDSTPCRWKGIHCDPNHNVISLRFYNANVSGTVGREIGKLKFLETLDFAFNKVSGPIPPELANCTNLVNVDLQYNLLTGELPSVLGNLQKLNRFSVYQNQLTGNIPESVFFIPNLKDLTLSYNHFTGVIPSSVGNMSELVSLIFDNNQFSGTIPHSIGNCTKLKEVWLDSNLLVGNLPDSLNNIESLVYLDVSSNGLDGTISYPSRNSGKNLTWLGFSNNLFIGEIPELGNSPRMEIFVAENNSLTGKIPTSLGSLRNLSALALGGNPLSGTIPPEIGNCESLMFLHIYENQLNGVIPQEFGMLRNLVKLSLYSNNLTGRIPTEFGQLSKLETLDISWNSLTGSLAPLAQLHCLTDVNVSHNQFDDPIPNRLFNSSSFLFSGNRGLCCLYQSRNSSNCSLCEKLSGDRKKHVNGVKAMIIAVSVVCAVMLAMLGYCFLWFKVIKNREFPVFSGAGSTVQLGDVLKPAQGLNGKHTFTDWKNHLTESPSMSERERSVV